MKLDSEHLVRSEVDIQIGAKWAVTLRKWLIADLVRLSNR